MVDSFFDRIEKINDYGSVAITLASPNDIRSWSFGEVKKPETINYRTYRPEKDGLFCERIFGPERDYECACGKYKGTKFKGIICDRCGVKVTHSRVRRKRMGHINLAAPIVHIWFFKATPSRLGNLMGMKTTDLEKIIYFQDYVVTDPGASPLKPRQMLTEDEYRQALDQYGSNFTAMMGAEAIQELLIQMDLDATSAELRTDLDATRSKQKQRDLAKRLKIVDQIRGSENRPEWMVMDVVPVIPPDLRPLVLLESGNFATSDLNDLYRRIINRNNRLKKLMDLNAPEVIIRNEKRMLQQAVDALFDNGRCRRPVLGSSNRPLKSLTDMIKGKQGRFRENLLGKRVDYSARSVIVVGPELKLYQCGLPKKIALELYQPFIIRRLKDHGLADTIKSAKRMLERRDPEVWDVLEEVIYQHPVMLNRAPTLHRMGIQAFEPVLVEGNAIKIHPLVCTGFNADFDGDQMAVHLPLSIEAQTEAHVLMMATHNVFSPASGRPIISPSQDIVMGVYYITSMTRDVDASEENQALPRFRDANEALLAYDLGKIKLQEPIVVRFRIGRYSEMVDQQTGSTRPFPPNNRLVTTVGRIIFNDICPPDMPYYNCALGKKGCSRVIDDVYLYRDRAYTLDFLDDMKSLGFKRSTLAGLSFGVTDLRIPSKKNEIIGEAQGKADKIEKAFHAGALTERERYNQLLDIWAHCREQVTKEMVNELRDDRRNEQGAEMPVDSAEGKPYLNPVYLMSDSGARGNISQMQQLAGMRGLMSKPSGEIIETPIRANFREGLNVLEYFSSTHGARKGLADTALKTADSGYLTRKLADVAQNVIVNSRDCGTNGGVPKKAIYKGEEIDVPLRQQIIGRIARETIRNPITDELIVAENAIITDEAARKIEDLGIDSVTVRSPLTCESPMGICAKCYGMDMSTGRLVEEGMAVGIIAAQSIGEPGTQLTMRTFHTGGVATRRLTENNIKAAHGGTIELRDCNEVPTRDEDDNEVLTALKRNGEIVILDAKGREMERYKLQYGTFILVKPGQAIRKGQILARWDPHRTPILAEKSGTVRFEDIQLGETVRAERDDSKGKGSGSEALVVIEHKGEKHPRIVIEETTGISNKRSHQELKKETQDYVRENFDFQFVETPELSSKERKQVVTKLKESGHEPSDEDAAEISWLGKLANKLSDYIKSMVLGDDPTDTALKEAQDICSGNKWYSWPPSSQRTNVPKHSGLCFLRDQRTKKIDFISETSDIYNRLNVHFNGDVDASPFFKKQYEICERSTSKSAGSVTGKILDFHYLPAKARIEVKEGQVIQAGHMLARQPREVAGSADIVGGLPRVTEIFEARKPKEPAVMAEISGTVELRSDKRRGKMTIIVRSEAGLEKEHHVPQDRHLLVHTGDYVAAGDPLIDGPLIPHDILRIKGEEALYNYLLDEVQNVYRAQGVPINDKHIEVILSQMLHKVRVESPGDTNLLPFDVVDKFNFRAENQRISHVGKISDPGDTGLTVGELVLKADIKEANAKAEADGKQPARAKRPRPATARTLLLGITKASLQSESFLSGASFQETTKVLTGAALAGMRDELMGLKENVLLGHLIPAGTGFKPYTGIRVEKLAEPVEQAKPTGEELMAEATAVAEALGAELGLHEPEPEQHPAEQLDQHQPASTAEADTDQP